MVARQAGGRNIHGLVPSVPSPPAHFVLASVLRAPQPSHRRAKMLRHLLDSLEKNRESIQTTYTTSDHPRIDAAPEPTSTSPKATPAKSRYFLPRPYQPYTPVWAVNYDHSRLIHSPSFISFQHHSDTASDRPRTLPPPNESKRRSKAIMTSNGGPHERVRRLPNYVQVADAYIFQQTIDERLRRIGVTQAREDSMRIAGVQYIDNVRKALKL